MGGWILGVVVLTAGMVAGGGALLVRLRADAIRQQALDAEVRSRADQQHTWTIRGDIRGVYGAEGAELIRTLPPTKPPITPPGDALEVAGVVRSPGELAAMLETKPPCWRHAAFVSVLVQRRDAVAARVRNARMGFAGPSGETLASDVETAVFFTERLADLSDLIGEIDGFMLSPAFQQAFGDPFDADTADATAIVHAGQRLMDYHDSLLALAERSRGAKVPRGCADLQHDFGLLTVLPIEGFATFIADLTDRVAELGDVARYATGDVWLDNVELGVTGDQQLLERISARLRQLSRTG